MKNEEKQPMINLKYNDKHFVLGILDGDSNDLLKDIFLHPRVHQKFINIKPILDELTNNQDITVNIKDSENQFEYIVTGNCNEELKNRIIINLKSK